ncbi:hypothetical protein A2276_01245 [candidate division WOR-1 bacterium RIFOXYA12_FULL_43_27]|nr:MAG: hypothetical protein A2276_01245 [candidate division WOR-1 bacterium RIFOXYA12_FULL_43_27]OGC20689.1 MAG: hypothetical protein A2292_06630 [candidate division WOR-1 bacterium RIFOXYB2_FULL_46_45]OGC31574.1 MAG: hypothetical protein A2232_04820 [candidate division WOR-1 bacterium RIFOXYA2_FULL_46_56]
MKDLGPRYDFHMHTIFSDGKLLPAAIVREAEIRGAKTIALTDHVDPSNINIAIPAIMQFLIEMKGKLPINVLCGAEVSYLLPEHIAEYCKKARALGAKIIIVHGESVVENVYPGTNHAAVQLKGLVDILAHPGKITEEDVKLAAKNEIFLELSARAGHGKGNAHVAKLAKKYGAKMLLNTDAHTENDLVTQEEAFKIALAAGLSEKDALTVISENPLELLKRI